MIDAYNNTEPLDPKPVIKLQGEDGNAFFIIGRAITTLRKSGAKEDYIANFTKEAQSGDYDHVLQTIFKYFEVS